MLRGIFGASGVFTGAARMGFETRKSRADGRKAWNDLKKHMELSEAALAPPRADLGPVYAHICGLLGTTTPDAIDPAHEEHHFAIQLARLLVRSGPSWERLAQIGYNLGQLLCALEQAPGCIPAELQHYLWYDYNPGGMQPMPPLWDPRRYYSAEIIEQLEAGIPVLHSTSSDLPAQ